MDMKFTPEQRLIISNQFEILKELSHDEDTKKVYQNYIEIVTNGYSRYYNEFNSGIDKELSNADCKFVADSIDLYSDLHYAWENDTEIRESIEESQTLFKGFDLNEYPRYYGLYKFLLEDLKRFSDIKKLIDEKKIDGYNSHGFGPAPQKLKEMIERLNIIHENSGYKQLTLNDIKIILNMQ